MAVGPLLSEYLITRSSYEMPFYIVAGAISLCGVLTHFSLDNRIENEIEEEERVNTSTIP